MVAPALAALIAVAPLIPIGLKTLREALDVIKSTIPAIVEWVRRKRITSFIIRCLTTMRYLKGAIQYAKFAAQYGIRPSRKVDWFIWWVLSNWDVIRFFLNNMNQHGINFLYKCSTSELKKAGKRFNRLVLGGHGKGLERVGLFQLMRRMVPARIRPSPTLPMLSFVVAGDVPVNQEIKEACDGLDKKMVQIAGEELKRLKGELDEVLLGLSNPDISKSERMSLNAQAKETALQLTLVIGLNHRIDEQETENIKDEDNMASPDEDNKVLVLKPLFANLRLICKSN
jgi:hypothetical protein